MKVAALYDVREADVVVSGVDRAIAEIEESHWAIAREFVAENLRVAVAREEAVAQLEAR